MWHWIDNPYCGFEVLFGSLAIGHAQNVISLLYLPNGFILPDACQQILNNFASIDR